MPLNIAAAPAANPQLPGVNAGAVAAPAPAAAPPAAPAAPAGLNAQAGANPIAAAIAAPGAPPPPVPGTQAALEPKTQAGVDLTRIVLRIASATIAILILYLVVMDFRIASDLNNTFQIKNSHGGQSEAGAYAAARIKQFSQDLSSANDPAWKADPTSVSYDQSVIDSLAMLPGITPSLKQQLSKCLTDISTAATGAAIAERAKDLPPCIATLDANRQDAIDYAEAVDQSQFAEKAAEELNQQRQSLHQFWLQAAQLVLLNLLLPVLTALLGYTFGQQAK
jgi:hypothetical protein